MLKTCLFLSLFFFPIGLLSSELSSIEAQIDMMWILIASALVFFMQAGFGLLETGMIRAKNTINVAMKNFTDFTVAVIIFWFVGFGFMFGETFEGILGFSGFGLSGLNTSWDYTFFIFQVVFAGTAATIISGAIAERMKFAGYLVITVCVTAVIYPISGHWIWGGGLLSEQTGWLQELGFLDFAGSTVVHSVGGWVGLAIAWVLGPRIGRYDKNGNLQEIPGHNLQMASIGVLILWLGWFGFNGGSTLSSDESIAIIILNTNLSAAAGAVTSLLISFVASNSLKVESILNGALAGLVGVTAGCAYVGSWGSIFIGITSSIVMLYSTWLLNYKLKIDDPVGAIPVHGFCGAWGTLILSLVAPIENLPTGSHFIQFGVQLLGVVVVFCWAFAGGLLIAKFLKSQNIFRIDKEGELQGLNITEHGAKMTWLDTLKTIHSVMNSGNLSNKANVEIGTEAGEVAHSFNDFVKKLHHTISDITLQIDKIIDSTNQLVKFSRTISTNSEQMKQQSSDIAKSSNTTSSKVKEIAVYAKQTTDNITTASVEQLSTNINILSSSSEEISKNMSEINKNNHEISEDIYHVATTLDGMSNSLSKVNESTHHAVDISNEANKSAKKTLEDMNLLQGVAHKIGNVVNLIEEIAEQTNILALNASIEAARAGEAGKGFAVVALEVKKLANQTSEANSQVGDYIQQIRSFIFTTLNSTKATSKHILDVSEINNSISFSMQEQVLNATQITNSVENIAQSSKESIKNINESTLELVDVTNSIAELSTAAQGAVKSITNASSGLEEVNKSSMKATEEVEEINGNIQDVQVSITNIDDGIHYVQKNIENLVEISNVLKLSIDFFKLSKKEYTDSTKV